jgi:hypothetical protein
MLAHRVATMKAVDHRRWGRPFARRHQHAAGAIIIIATLGWSRHRRDLLPIAERTRPHRRGAGHGLLAVLALLGVLLTGCAELTPTEVRQIERDGTSVRPLLDPDSIAIPGTSSEEVVAVLGEPDDTEETRPATDQRPGTVITMRYDGAEIVVYELREPTRSFISEMTITSSEYVTRLPVGVGASRGDIEDVLGAPTAPDDDAEEATDAGSEAPTEDAAAGSDVVYALTDDGDRCIVTYDGDRATRMRFTFS